jgi:hypothetical protein
MAIDLLTVREAACRLRIAAATLYDWLGQSDHGRLIVRGTPFTIQYFQGGPKGQGRIGIEVGEIERLQQAMRVANSTPRPAAQRTAHPAHAFPGITVKLGRPNR